MYLFKKHLQPTARSISRYMHIHHFSNFFRSQDNFFNNPDKVVDLANKLDFIKSPVHPGTRTKNLFEINQECASFGTYLAKRIADEIFIGMRNLKIDIRFHKNDVYDDPDCNAGWIHNDPVKVAGVIYLNQGLLDMQAGTSMFAKTSNRNFSTPDITSRNKFNLSKEITQQYKQDLEDNHSHFKETLKCGNVYNRLIAYDSSIFHRPNNYVINNGEQRLSIIFFIEHYEYTQPKSLLSVTPDWNDR